MSSNKPQIKKRGRPRKHKTDVDRVKHHRKLKQDKGITRIESYIDTGARWRLKELSKAWGCPMGQVFQRLLIEADDQYKDILFPEV